MRQTMEAFHWIVVPISTILGLSLARLLGGYVAAVKGRAGLRFDWLPLVFAAAILGAALQFWWALLELSGREHWSLSAFTLLVAMILALFTAAALISPSDADSDLRRAFERDGHWALLALATFHTLAIVANSWLWGVPLISVDQALQLLLALLCAATAFVRRRRFQEGAALVYLLSSLADILVASISTY
ncbi:hypothetical protein RHIZO_04758 [Rhizobiaceae bacterium]|nr:hypothetical protein RHIZO_04758 [Rhizobiaceae bacterium]